MSNYGYVDKDILYRYARVICDVIGHGVNNTAVNLIVETAITETGGGTIEDKTDGAGMGVTQFDRFPFEDLRERSLRLRVKIMKNLGVDITKVQWDDLRYNTFLSLLFTRLQYFPFSEEIPKTIEERANYWKKYYNTEAGKGTPQHYLEMNKKYKG